MNEYTNDELLSPLESNNRPVNIFRGVMGQAIANTTGIAVFDIVDEPKRRHIQYTTYVPDDTGVTESWHAMTYDKLLQTEYYELVLWMQTYLEQVRDKAQVMWKPGYVDDSTGIKANE